MKTPAQQLEANRRWKKKNPAKVNAQKRRWRKRHPEKYKVSSTTSANKRIRKNIEKLALLLFDNKLPSKCKICGATEDLHIHHKRYRYPIILRDLERICGICSQIPQQKDKEN